MARNSGGVITIRVLGATAVTVALSHAAVDQGRLTEEVAGPQARQHLVAAAYLDLALLDREELGGPLSLAHQVLALGHIDLVGMPGHLAELPSCPIPRTAGSSPTSLSCHRLSRR